MPKRTDPQRKAIEVACRELADQLNEEGIDQRKMLKKHIDIPWTQEAVKKQIFTQIAQSMNFIENSTTELDKDKVDLVWRVIQRELLDKFKVEVSNFPSKEHERN